MRAPLRVGVIGLGMAGGVMIPVIDAHPGLALAGAADREDLLRERFAAAFDVPVVADAEALVHRADIDAVYVATPHQFHVAHAIAAAKAGKHVVVEKPMALTIADCDAMIDAARAAGVALIVGHTHGFDPTITRMREMIDSGKVGRPRVITSLNYTNFIYRPRRAEELDAAAGGGVVWNQLPHQIDMIRSLVDAPVRSVNASLHALDADRKVEALGSVMLTFTDGAVATLTYSGYDRFDTDVWHDWIGESGNQRQAVHGSVRQQLSAGEDERRARIERMGFGGDAYRAFDPVGAPHFGVLIVSCEKADLVQTARGFDVFSASGKSSVYVPITPKRPAHHAVWEELIDAAYGASAKHDGEFGRATVEVVLAIVESARSGQAQVLR